MYKQNLALNNLQGLIYHKKQPTNLCKYKQDLALNSLQGLICHKTNKPM